MKFILFLLRRLIKRKFRELFRKLFSKKEIKNYGHVPHANGYIDVNDYHPPQNNPPSQPQPPPC